MSGKDAASRLSFSGKPFSELDHIVNADGQYLFCKYWKPEGDPKALTIIVHGMGEHCQRYERIATTLTKHSILVMAHDHVGHGESEGTRLDVTSFHIYVRDLFQHIDLMKSKYPKLPIFLLGHSMGGAISILAAYERSSLFTGIVLSSPAIDVNRETVGPFKVFMAKMLGSILPQVALGHIQPEFVTRSPEHRKSYAEDPLIYHGGIKARIGYQTLVGMDRIKNGLQDITWPFLLQHGDDDKLCEISGSRLMFEKASSKDKTLTIYEGCCHELDKELEEDAAKVVAEIEEWIVKRMPAGDESADAEAEPAVAGSDTVNGEADGVDTEGINVETNE